MRRYTSTAPRFQALFQAAGRGEFDVVLPWALDRLRREGLAETYRHISKRIT